MMVVVMTVVVIAAVVIMSNLINCMQHVVGGLPASAEFAEVRRILLPTFEVGGGGEGVDSGVEQELEGAGLEVVHVALPHGVLFLSCGESEDVSLHSEGASVLLPLLLALAPHFIPHFSLYLLTDLVLEVRGPLTIIFLQYLKPSQTKLLKLRS